MIKGQILLCGSVSGNQHLTLRPGIPAIPLSPGSPGTLSPWKNTFTF